MIHISVPYFVIFYYGTENEEAIQAGAGSEWGIEVGYSFSIPKQVSCQYGTLMWIIAVSSSSSQSSLSILTQKYLRKCKDTYFILQNK